MLCTCIPSCLRKLHAVFNTGLSYLDTVVECAYFCHVPPCAVLQCPNEFIVGYGLDFNECYRCLPYVAALKEEAYEGKREGH